MTDAYQPSDPLRRPTGLPPEAEAVDDSPIVPVAGSTTPPTYSAPPTPGAPPSSGGGQSSGVKDTAKEEAANVGGSAKDAAGRVAGTAKEEAHNVASEAKQQARQLFDTTMQEARDQASTQQHRAAEGMRTVASDLSSMASGEGASDGLASQLVGEVGSRIESAASWVSEREPADLLDELKTYARRHPVTFIAVAGIAGLLVGRLTRGLIAEAKDEHGASGSTGSSGSTTGAYSGGSATTAGTGYVAPPPRNSAGEATAWTDEPPTGTAASDAIYGTRPTEERGL